MRQWLLVAALILTLLAGTSGARAESGAMSFSDMSGHWAMGLVAQAEEAGYVHGYPDGTFRPDAPVTRAEIIKLLAVAGRLSLDGQVIELFEDAPTHHWAASQGYLTAAVAYELVPWEGLFRPDDPATRLEVLQFAVRLLNKPYSDPADPQGALPFADLREDGRRWVQAGLDLGLVQGYPDGTFRPDNPVTRAEAIAIVERTIQHMTAGTDHRLRLVVNGRPIPDAELAIRDGYVYAPGNAIYWKDWKSMKAPRVLGHAANDRFSACAAVLVIDAGERVASWPTDRALPELAALPYWRLDQLMIPVAPVGGKGTIPYAEANHDAGSGAVTVSFTQDWPEYSLPRSPDMVRFMSPAALQLDPKTRPSVYVETPGLMDPKGNCVKASEKLPVTFSVDADGPLRLRGEGEETLLISYTMGPANNWKQPELVVLPDPQEGTYSLHIAALPYGPTEQQVTVTDAGTTRLVLEASGPVKVGQEVTIRISAVDRFGRPTLFSMTGYPGGPITNPLVVTGPGRGEVPVEPLLHRSGTYYYVMWNGSGSFTFTPGEAGTYRVSIPGPQESQDIRSIEGTFEVAP